VSDRGRKRECRGDRRGKEKREGRREIREGEGDLAVSFNIAALLNNTATRAKRILKIYKNTKNRKK
jgi:hypothetical protein